MVEKEGGDEDLGWGGKMMDRYNHDLTALTASLFVFQHPPVIQLSPLTTIFLGSILENNQCAHHSSR